MKKVFFYDYPVGTIGIAEDCGNIAGVFFGKRDLQEFEVTESDLICECRVQLDEYFKGKRQSFDLPIAPRGTVFQKSVWRVVQTIPAAQTRSYSDVAASIGNPKACRAVGMANHCNPIAIIIPCHRVTGKNGALTGYAGGLNIKQYLLDLERGSLMGNISVSVGFI